MSTGDEERLREWAHDGETETASVLDAVSAGDSAPERFLVVRNGDEVALVDLPPSGECLLGRSEEADVTIEDRRVSFRHARLTIAPNTLYVEDLGSHNGTRVNGQLLGGSRAQIGIGDVIEVGPMQLVVAARAKKRPVIETSQ